MQIDAEQIEIVIGLGAILATLLGIGWRFLKLERFMREHDRVEQLYRSENCAHHAVLFRALKIPHDEVIKAEQEMRARDGHD